VDKKNQRGFTLVEIVAVMVTVTILAAYAVPHMMGSGGFAARTNADRLLAALQYAQTLAQRQGVATSVAIAATTPNIAVLQNNLAVNLQNESYNGLYKIDLHPDVSVTPSATVIFGTNGIPTAGTGTYSIKENGTTRFTIVVEATGFTHFGS